MDKARVFECSLGFNQSNASQLTQQVKQQFTKYKIQEKRKGETKMKKFSSRKKAISILLSTVLITMVLTMSACGRGGNDALDLQLPGEGETVTLVIGATPAPHAEVLALVADMLEEEGIILDIREFTDFQVPNTVLGYGDIDANYFQHQPFLTSFNENQGTDIVAVGGIHYEPLGIYPGQSNDLENIADGATIAIPNDVTNAARALNLLETNGLITLRPDAGLMATVIDIVDNPHNLDIIEIEAPQLPRVLEDVDFAVINGNFALQAGLSVSRDALAYELVESEAAQTYTNILAVRSGDEDNPVILRLLEAMQSEEVRAFIEERYDGAVVPVF